MNPQLASVLVSNIIMLAVVTWLFRWRLYVGAVKIEIAWLRLRAKWYRYKIRRSGQEPSA